MMNNTEQITALKNALSALENAGMGNSQTALDLRRQIQDIENPIAEDFIYTTLQRNSKFVPYSDEMKKCIEGSVDALLQNSINAKYPVLLLGKIQCGKTNTFENIIGLAFDRGIDICVVMTKGTKTLATQTQQRFETDFELFKDRQILNQKGVVKIYDVLESFKKRGLPETTAQKAKIVIVCKKEKTNLDHLIRLFTEKSPYLKDKKVLVVDDEADFASCNFRSVRGVKSLAKISKQITEFIEIPKYCRFLQVTATPYALFLQPDGYFNLDENSNLTPKFKPRHTELVPQHSKYVGGQEYFVESQKPESMYSHLFVPVSEKCIDVMGKRNARYTSNGIASKNIEGLTRSIITYFIACAIRSIQIENNGGECYTSCLIHVDTDKSAHQWQSDLITKVIDDIRQGFVNSPVDGPVIDARIQEVVDVAYEDFCQSNEKGRSQNLITVDIPSLRDVRERIFRIFSTNDYIIQIVNSDNDVQACLNEKGQLQLEATANIFIGGSILDRGITIDNMLCFFYGRDPKNFQMDTVLQHARMYGSRAKEDMAVMRFYTTYDIYKMLKRINEIDEELRQLIIKMNDEDSDGEFKPEFIGYDNHIKPCASGKIKLSNVVLIKGQQRILPVGFQTGPKSSIGRTIDYIDQTISNYPGSKEGGFFDMDSNTAKEIVKAIRTTYIYEDNQTCTFNNGLEWDVNEMLAGIDYSLMGDGKEQKVIVHFVKDRNMSRLRENGNYVDAPDDGRTDLTPSRNTALEYPVLMLIRENGRKEDGWRDTPFYWPVLVMPSNIKNSMYTLNGITKSKDMEIIDESALGVLPGGPDEVLRLTLAGDPFWNILFGYQDIETRLIKPTTASKYLISSPHTTLKYQLRTDIAIEPGKVSSVESYNDGTFPFETRKFKYILFRNSRDYSGSLLLVKLAEDFCTLDPEKKKDLDVLHDSANNSTQYEKESLCNWYIYYKIEEVMSFKLNTKNTQDYEDIKADLLAREEISADEIYALDGKKR